jgi:hypothetical protein
VRQNSTTVKDPSIKKLTLLLPAMLRRSETVALTMGPVERRYAAGKLLFHF